MTCHTVEVTISAPAEEVVVVVVAVGVAAPAVVVSWQVSTSSSRIFIQTLVRVVPHLGGHRA